MADTKDKDKQKEKETGQLPKINMKPRALKVIQAVAKPEPEAQKAQLEATPKPAQPKGRPKGAKNKNKAPVLVVEEEQKEKQKEPLSIAQKEEIIDRMVDKNVAAGKVLAGRMANDIKWELKGRLRGWSPGRIAQEQTKASEREEERVPENVVDLTNEAEQPPQELKSADEQPVLIKNEAEEEAKKKVRKQIKEIDADWNPSRPPHPVLWKTNNAEYNKRLQQHQSFLLELGEKKAVVEASAATDETWGFYVGWMGATVSLMLIRMALGSASL